MRNNKKGQFERITISISIVVALILVIILISSAENSSGFISSALARFENRCLNCSATTIFFMQSLPFIVILFLAVGGFIAWRSVNG